VSRSYQEVGSELLAYADTVMVSYRAGVKYATPAEQTYSGR
jgi:hypothetical protein